MKLLLYNDRKPVNRFPHIGVTAGDVNVRGNSDIA